MTLFKPTLIVKRMVIRCNEAIAYDEPFHEGVNVIRGENSSGKSTIMSFLFYGLGGDMSDWSDAAKLCTHIWLEVELNGMPTVLRREIVTNSLAPMEIYGGRYEDAVNAPIDSWKKYPYIRTKNLESFSQALFRLLEMPDVANELSGNVTMHQIIRLLYADQLSPIEKLFREESFDSADLRDTVGNLLCGAFDTDIYESQQLLTNKEKLFQKTAAELRSIISILGGEESVGVNWVNAQRQNLKDIKDSVFHELKEAEEQYFISAEKDEITLSRQQSAYKRTNDLQTKLVESRNKIRQVEFDISDSEDFINQIANKIESLRDAENIASFITGIHFSNCPACFAEVDELPDNMQACALCKTPHDKDRARERIAGIINDAAIQLKQSQVLQAQRKEKLLVLSAEESKLYEDWKVSAKELESLQAMPSTAAQQNIRELNRKLGYLDRQMEDLEQKLKLAQRIENLSLQKQSLIAEIEGLKNYIALMRSKQTSRLSAAKKAIEEETISLLRNDLSRQDTFENPDSLSFSFRKNQIEVDGHTYFSASSRVILKCSFMLGFLNAALKDNLFRHPRFVIIDVTENNGMEIQRSHNLQHQMLKISEQSNVKHQIICATAFPSPEIPDELLVGEFSTRDNRTLHIPGEW